MVSNLCLNQETIKQTKYNQSFLAESLLPTKVCKITL